MHLTVFILTFNEEIHIERCIASARDFADRIVVIDSHSTDRTVELAHAMGAEVLVNDWVNHATQVNWAIDQMDEGSEWLLRLDADEVITPELGQELRESLPYIDLDIAGIFIPLGRKFMGQPVRFGGLSKIKLLRLFRYGQGRCIARLMDEYIGVEGRTSAFRGKIVDDNLNSLSWWTSKHNVYSNLEAAALMNLEYNFMPRDSFSDLRGEGQSGLKRWVKESLYARLPGGFRAFAYFFYRYIIRLGFLDGRAGTAFHFLQGFWYRYLVDAKVTEVKRYMQKHNCSVQEAIERILSIKV